MKWILALFFAVCFLSGPVRAAELVMFESATCEWCDIWHHDVGGVYAMTREGRLAPLRRVEIDDPRPEDLRPIRGVVYTPTFVLMENGREIGRITGYPGEWAFWGLLGGLLQKTDAALAGCRRDGAIAEGRANAGPKTGQKPGENHAC